MIFCHSGREPRPRRAAQHESAGPCPRCDDRLNGRAAIRGRSRCHRPQATVPATRRRHRQDRRPQPSWRRARQEQADRFRLPWTSAPGAVFESRVLRDDEMATTAIATGTRPARHRGIAAFPGPALRHDDGSRAVRGNRLHRRGAFGGGASRSARSDPTSSWTAHRTKPRMKCAQATSSQSTRTSGHIAHEPRRTASISIAIAPVAAATLDLAHADRWLCQRPRLRPAHRPATQADDPSGPGDPPVPPGRARWLRVIQNSLSNSGIRWTPENGRRNCVAERLSAPLPSLRSIRSASQRTSASGDLRINSAIFAWRAAPPVAPSDKTTRHGKTRPTGYRHLKRNALSSIIRSPAQIAHGHQRNTRIHGRPDPASGRATAQGSFQK